MKLFAAGLATESNTFAPMPTGLADFSVFRGAPPEEHPTSFTQPFLVWQRERLHQRAVHAHPAPEVAPRPRHLRRVVA